MGNLCGGGLSVYNASGVALRVTFSAFGRPVCWSSAPVEPNTTFACEAPLPFLCYYGVSVAVAGDAGKGGPATNALHGVLVAGQCVGVERGLELRVVDAYELSRRLRRSSPRSRAIVVERSALVEGPAFLLKVIALLVLARLAAARRLLGSWWARGSRLPAAAPIRDDDDDDGARSARTGAFSELAEDDGAVLVDADAPDEADYVEVLAFSLAGADGADVGAAAAAQWDDPSFYARFLQDVSPDVGDWVQDRRTVLTRHPLGVRPPSWTGVRAAIPTRKKQRRYRSPSRVVVSEESQFQDIPLSDAILVRTLWVVDAVAGDVRCRVLFRAIFGDAVPRWLRSVIEKRTKDELGLVYDAYEAETRRALGID